MSKTQAVRTFAPAEAPRDAEPARATQFALPIEDGFGELTEVLSLLSSGGVEVLAVATDREAGSAVAFLLVDQARAARRILEEADRDVVCSDVLLLRPSDLAEGAGDAMSRLKQEGVAVRRVYGVRVDGQSRLVVEADDPARAAAALAGFSPRLPS